MFLCVAKNEKRESSLTVAGFARQSNLWGVRRKDGRETEKATCLNLGKQRCCIAFFSLSIVSECLGRREVLAFCAAFVLWPAEWPSGKPEWAGGGAISSIKCHSISFTGVYFLFICRIRDMDTSLFLSGSPLVLPTACLLSLLSSVFLKLTQYFIIFSLS